MEQVIQLMETNHQSDVTPYESRLSDLCASYEMTSVEGKTADMAILIIHFGLLCRSALDRLNHHVDGFVIAIQHNGRRYKVFRKLKRENETRCPKLRLLKSA